MEVPEDKNKAIDLWRRIHYAKWDLALDLFTETLLVRLRKKVTAERILLSKAKTVDELDRLFEPLIQNLAKDILEGAGTVGSLSLLEGYRILSIDGRSPLIKPLPISPDEFKEMLRFSRIVDQLTVAYVYWVRRPFEESLNEPS